MTEEVSQVLASRTAVRIERRRGPGKLTRGNFTLSTANPDAGQGLMEEDICNRSDLVPT